MMARYCHTTSTTSYNTIPIHRTRKSSNTVMDLACTRATDLQCPNKTKVTTSNIKDTDTTKAWETNT